MSYLVMKSSPSATPESFQLTNTCNKPRLVVSGSYIPLTNTGGGSSDLKVKDNNGNTYRAMVYESSSSSSSVQETTGYSGVSSRVSYYQTTLDNPSGLSSVTNLTRVETYNTVYLSTVDSTCETKSSIYYLGRGPAKYVKTTRRSGTVITNAQNSGAFVCSFSGFYTRITEDSDCIYVYNTDSNIKYLIAMNQTVSTVDTSLYGYNIVSATFRNYLGAKNYTFTLTGITISTDTYNSVISTSERIYSTEYLTSVSVSAYAGSSSKQYDYYTSSTDRANMSNITNLTASSSESASMMTWV